MSSLKKNLFYNFCYQILVLFLPIISTPYISRILGPDGIGINSYTYSIVNYFIIFSMLGVNNYGNRMIAKNRDDKEKMSKIFKEIHGLQVIVSSIMLVVYFLYLYFFEQKYPMISLIQSLYILSCMFDINWFFFGIEKFKLTVGRNLLIKIISLISIFCFIKQPEDVWIYTLILALSNLLSNLFLFPFLRRYIVNVKYNLSDLKKHIAPNLKLFLTVIAVSIYKVMDKTMLGGISGVKEVGFYENAEKVINIPIAIITALGTVMLPRMSNIYSKDDKTNAESLIQKSMKFIMFLAFAMTFGLVAISNDFSSIFFGESFSETGILISLLAITIIFLAWGNVLRTQYLIPKEKDKEYIISAFIGAAVNFVFNLILIPKYNAVGACLGTIFAEFSVMLYQSMKINKELHLMKYIKDVIPFLVKAIVMFVLISCINFLNLSGVLTITLQIIFGIIIYLLLNIKYILSVIKFKYEKEEEAYE